MRQGRIGQASPHLCVKVTDTSMHRCVLHCTTQAIRAGLKALQGLGVWGVVVNVWWNQVEPLARQYDWAQYQAVFDAAKELGLRVKVRLWLAFRRAVGASALLA